MRPNSYTMIIRSLIAVLAVFFTLADFNSCSGPSKPKDVKYNLYVGATHFYASPEDSSFNRIYIYDADSLTLLDSIWQAHYAQDVAVSPDGRWLFVLDFTLTHGPRTLWKINAQTRQVAWSRSGRSGRLRFQDNGGVLLAGNDVLDPEDGSILRHLSDSLVVLWGPGSGTKVAATVRGSLTEYGYDSVVTAVDVTSGERSGRFVAHLPSGLPLDHFFTARLHPDQRRVLAIGVLGSVYNSWFVVGDLLTGQTLFTYRINFPRGEIAINSDSSLAVFTDPGVQGFGESGIPYLIDLRTYGVITPPPADLALASQVRFLPDNRRIVTAPAAEHIWSGGPVDVLDVATLKRQKRVWPTGSTYPTPPSVGGIGIGPRP